MVQEVLSYSNGISTIIVYYYKDSISLTQDKFKDLGLKRKLNFLLWLWFYTNDILVLQLGICYLPLIWTSNSAVSDPTSFWAVTLILPVYSDVTFFTVNLKEEHKI